VTAVNHLVLAAHDLAQIRRFYEELGFTLTPAGQHPFGTGNTIIQLPGAYLELLAVTQPGDVVEHSTSNFSFSAFNRDYLQRHEGFSMVVFNSADARSDLRRWQAAGLKTFEPFEFSRQAMMPDGSIVTVGFVLAQTSLPSAPWLGHFACQHFRPDYYEQPQFLTHANGARRIAEVWISGPRALDTAGHFQTITMMKPHEAAADRLVFSTRTADLVIASSQAFESAFGIPPPHPGDGPHLCGLTIACNRLDRLPANLVMQVGERKIVPPSTAFGTALAFTSA